MRRKNMTRASVLLLAVSALGLPAIASAQPEGGVVATPPDEVFFIANGAPVMPIGGRIDVLSSFGAVPGERVQDKPYSASSITESVQILADGNKITHRNESRVYRDSAGRTRREQTVNGLGAWQPANESMSMITIDDPVAEVSYLLNPTNKTAQQLRSFKLATAGPVAMQWQAGVPVTAPLSRGGPPSVGAMIRTEARVEAVPGGPVPQQFEVAVAPPPPGAVAGVRAYAPSAAGVVQSFGGTIAGSIASNMSARTEDLGEQILEGVLARGSRQIRTIPAGTIGNQRDIEIVDEQWYSPDIEAVVLTRSSDPRFGETTYQLVSVALTEPPPDLFAVPQGYEIIADTITPAQRLEAAPGAPPPGQRLERRMFIVQPDPTKNKD
jgi:hypothetical protein